MMAEGIELPKSIRVGYRTYEIVPMSAIEKREYSGTQHGDLHIIKIDTALPPSEIAKVLLHEIFHAIWLNAGIEDPGKITEEYICSVFSNVFTQVLQDSPETMTWIRHMAAPPKSDKSFTEIMEEVSSKK